ncbi:DUF3106 domain-containing protein [Roseateles sp. BYS87W]|uniref:DUF3106 domain-containing protein n=1 Tax=Pelomonas baiyunensis TaxID=3299026 RepID=A0ABW7GV49_9BURK
MPMTRAAKSPAAIALPCFLTLLLSAAGFSAFAQANDAASAPEGASASAPAVPSAAAPTPLAARPSPAALPAVSALAPAPTWQALNPAQRSLLAPLAQDWDHLSANQRSKWLSTTPRLAALPPAELTRLHERMRDWARLSPAERTDARVTFQVAQQVGADQRQAKWEEYLALPAEKRQELADKAAARRAAQAQAKAPGAAANPLANASTKSNTVPAAPKIVVPVAVAGSLVQAKPGATTVLITRGLALPSHHAAGESKVVADPALVDPKTLLPKSLKAPQATPERP